jgi:hypothetical protein
MFWFAAESTQTFKDVLIVIDVVEKVAITAHKLEQAHGLTNNFTFQQPFIIYRHHSQTSHACLVE